MIRHRLFTILCCLTLLLTTSCSPTKMDMAEFSRLKPFKGRVVKVEEIETHYRSDSGPDLRVTVLKPNGSAIVINRVHTTLMTCDPLKKLVEKKECDLPNEILQYADQLGTK